jgi:hypothetical protein
MSDIKTKSSLVEEELGMLNADEIDVGVNDHPMEVVGNEVEIYSEHNPVNKDRISFNSNLATHNRGANHSTNA